VARHSSANAEQRLLDYDEVGNLVNDSRSAATNLALTYGITGRLKQITQDNGEQAIYTYNAKGQRVSKTVSAGDGSQQTLYFIYSPFDKLIAEMNEDGSPVREYIYSAGERVAVVDYQHQSEGQLLYTYNDHLGSPALMMDTDKQVVWRAARLPFGDTLASVNSTNQMFGFPGQYEDQETGFHYNYYRDYDPSLGRYLQSDPIGLAGGVNTFGYVLGNPLIYVDPLGTDVRLENTAAVYGYHQRVSVDTWEANPNWRIPMRGDLQYTKTGTYGISFGMTSRELPQQGFFDAMGEVPAFGKEGSGIVYVDNDPATEIQKVLTTTPQQDIMIKQQFEKEVGKTGPYNAFSNSCRNFSSRTFNSL